MNNLNYQQTVCSNPEPQHNFTLTGPTSFEPEDTEEPYKLNVKQEQQRVLSSRAINNQDYTKHNPFSPISRKHNFNQKTPTPVRSNTVK